MNKTGNPYYEQVYKTTKGNYFICGTYEDMVKERMKKEGLTPNFVSEEYKVGEHLNKCLLFNDNTQKHYLQYYVFPNSIHETEYEYEGRNIDRELFKSFEVKKSESSRQPQENKHTPLSLTLNNIKKITLNGTRYTIVEG